MKIKCLMSQGSIMHGDIVDAIKSPKVEECIVYDSTGCMFYFYSGQFEVVEDFSSSISSMSIRDLLGQDLRTIEFK